MSKIVLGLDVSSTSTGWAVIKSGRFYKREGIDYGWIKPSRKYSLVEKLDFFGDSIEEVVFKVSPDYIGIEDIFLSRNVKTLKVLGRFSGVALRDSYRESGIIPKIVQVREARAKITGTQNKIEVFNFVKKKYKLHDWEFDSHNDITDAIVVALYVGKIQEK